MNYLKFLFLVSTIIITGCSSLEERRQKDTRLLVEYALSDFPIPSKASISEDETVILGSGNKWSGKVTYYVEMSPQELVKFYDASTPQVGWNMTSSTISEDVILAFQKDKRFATVEVSRSSFLEGVKLLSSRATKVTISLNHADSIGVESTNNISIDDNSKENIK